jgi:hypothetical protein
MRISSSFKASRSFRNEFLQKLLDKPQAFPSNFPLIPLTFTQKKVKAITPAQLTNFSHFPNNNIALSAVVVIPKFSPHPRTNTSTPRKSFSPQTIPSPLTAHAKSIIYLGKKNGDIWHLEGSAGGFNSFTSHPIALALISVNIASHKGKFGRNLHSFSFAFLFIPFPFVESSFQSQTQEPTTTRSAKISNLHFLLLPFFFETKTKTFAERSERRQKRASP